MAKETKQEKQEKQKKQEKQNSSKLNYEDLNLEKKLKEYQNLSREKQKKYNGSFKKEDIVFEKVFVTLNDSLKIIITGKNIKLGVIRLKNVVLREILRIFISLLILTSVTGLMQWIQSEDLIYIVISILFIIVFEKVGYWIINRFLFIYKYKSLGLIMLIPTLISFILVCIIIPNIEIKSVWALLGAMILYLIFRRIMFSFIKQKGTIVIRRE